MLDDNCYVNTNGDKVELQKIAYKEIYKALVIKKIAYTVTKNFEYENYLDFQGDFALRRNITKKLELAHISWQSKLVDIVHKKEGKMQVETENTLCGNCNSRDRYGMLQL